MKNYLNLFLAVLFVVMLLSVSISIETIQKQKKEIARISQNIEVLTSENNTWKTRSGKQVMTIQELEVTSKELVKMRLIDQSTIKDLDIKLKRLTKINQTGIGTHINITPQVKDTTIIKDTIIYTCKTLNFNDPYVSVKGVICDTIPSALDIVHTDTIVSFAHIIPKKFLFIKYGVKEIRQEVLTKSPYSKLYYSKTINIK